MSPRKALATKPNVVLRSRRNEIVNTISKTTKLTIHKDTATRSPAPRASARLRQSIDKENLPQITQTIDQVGINGGTPARTFGKRKSISRSAKKKLRAPLRELDDGEVYERDTLVLGERRRRISGGEDFIEIDTVPALDDPDNEMNIEDEIATASSIAEIQIIDDRLSHVTNAAQVLKQDLESILASVAESKNILVSTTRDGKGSPVIGKRRALATKTRQRSANTTTVSHEVLLDEPLTKKETAKTASDGIRKKANYSPSKAGTITNKLVVKKNVKSSSFNSLKRSTAVGTTSSLSRATRSTTSAGLESIRRMR